MELACSFLWQVAVSDTGRDLIQWAQEVVAWGLGSLRPYWTRTAPSSGFDLEMLNRVAEVADVPIIALVVK